MNCRMMLAALATVVLSACGGSVSSYSGAVTSGSSWTVVAAGENHTVAVKTDGTLWAWGWNVYGQLGNGTTTDEHSPVQIGSGFASVAAGYYHTAAVKTDGTLWAWGLNGNGQLGNGTTTEQWFRVWLSS